MVNFEPALFRALKAFEQNQARDDHSQHRPPIIAERMTDPHQELRGHGQRNLHPIKNGHELGQHECHEKNDDGDPDTRHNCRVNHGGYKLRLHLGEPLVVVRQPPQHLHQRAALLAGSHHVDVQIRKEQRLFRHGIGKTFPLHDILLEIFADGGRNPF